MRAYENEGGGGDETRARFGEPRGRTEEHETNIEKPCNRERYDDCENDSGRVKHNAFDQVILLPTLHRLATDNEKLSSGRLL